MEFFLYQIVARIVAIYLCVDCWRKIRNGLVERKTEYRFASSDLLDWFFEPPRWVCDRDTTPVRYWIQIGLQTFSLVACLVVAIHGWWRPTS